MTTDHNLGYLERFEEVLLSCSAVLDVLGARTAFRDVSEPEVSRRRAGTVMELEPGEESCCRSVLKAAGVDGCSGQVEVEPSGTIRKEIHR